LHNNFSFCARKKQMVKVSSKKEFNEIRSQQKTLSLFVFYTETSQKSKESLKTLQDFEESNKGIPVYSINASQVRDIHPIYGINTVPSVLVLKNGERINVIYGSQNKEYYENLLTEAIAVSSDSGKKVDRIVVYTSDACPWCARVKAYLKEMGKPFREVNLSRKQSEVEQLVKRTGQMGTPQTNINGTFVVGFDKPKIDQLLGIRTNRRRL